MTRRREIAAGLVMLGFGLAMLVKVTADLRIWSSGEPAAGFFPALIALSIALLAAAIVVQAALASPAGEGAEKRAPGGGEAGKARSGKVLAYLAAMIVFPPALEHLGFAIASFALLSFLLIFVERQPVGRSLAIATGCVVVSYCVFVIFLKVPLPSLGYWPL